MDLSLTGERITRVLEWPCETGGISAVIQSNNGPEFSGRMMDAWAYGRAVRLRLRGAGGVRGAQQTTKERAHLAHRVASGAGRLGATHGGVSVKEPESFFDPLLGSVKMGGKTVFGKRV